MVRQPQHPPLLFRSVPTGVSPRQASLGEENQQAFASGLNGHHNRADVSAPASCSCRVNSERRATEARLRPPWMDYTRRQISRQR
jgi:hypothetical protein